MSQHEVQHAPDSQPALHARATAQPPVLYIVVPCYNEQEVLPLTHKLFKDELQLLASKGKVSPESKILFVNDGSSDNTYALIEQLSAQDPQFCGMSLSRNRGHQNALLAGLMEARQHCDISISIDCDGQDDISVMEDMVDAYHNGCDVVYGVRSNRATDSLFKRTTAQGFYRVMGALGVESVYNHADYRLMSRRALDAFSQFEEVNLFLRGMVPLVGFTATSVYYERHERLAGKSHYPLSKMLALAINGITSLSIKPIRLITTLGFLVSLVAFLLIVWALIVHATGVTISGWTSLVVLILFMGGIQLISLGVIGEYVGRTYLETKHRPRYIIANKTPNIQD